MVMTADTTITITNVSSIKDLILNSSFSTSSSSSNSIVTIIMAISKDMVMT